MRTRNIAVAVLVLAVFAVIGIGAKTVLVPAAASAPTPQGFTPITSAPAQQGTLVTGIPTQQGTPAPTQQGTPVAQTKPAQQGTTQQCTPAPSGPGCIYPLPTQISLIPPPGNPVTAAPDQAGGQVSPAAIVKDVTGTQAFNGTTITRAEVIGTPVVSGGTETAEVNETFSGGAVVYRVRWVYVLSSGTWTASPEYQVSPG